MIRSKLLMTCSFLALLSVADSAVAQASSPISTQQLQAEISSLQAEIATANASDATQVNTLIQKYNSLQALVNGQNVANTAQLQTLLAQMSQLNVQLTNEAAQIVATQSQTTYNAGQAFNAMQEAVTAQNLAAIDQNVDQQQNTQISQLQATEQAQQSALTQMQSQYGNEGIGSQGGTFQISVAGTSELVMTTGYSQFLNMLEAPNALFSGRVAIGTTDNSRMGLTVLGSTSPDYLSLHLFGGSATTPTGIMMGRAVSTYGDAQIAIVPSNGSFINNAKAGDFIIKTPDNGSLLFASGLSPNAALVISPSNQIGVNNIAPAATLDVAGEVKVGSTNVPCTSANAGAVRFAGGLFYGCDGTTWHSLAYSN